MRRALALFLLAVIGLPLITPLLLADLRPELPTCCRRNGKHHCEMATMSGDQVPAAPSIKSLQAKCRFFPKPGAVPVNSKSAIAAIGSLVGPVDRVHFQIAQRSSTVPRITARGTEWKRGPPPSLS